MQKYIAMCGAASRRASEELIKNGHVKVNGEKVTEMGTKVEIGADKVELYGEVLSIETKNYYIMLNKPAGYVSAVTDQFDRPTVCDLLKEDISARLFPVGRLDYETEGLLLLTNDGDFTYRVTHPKFNMNKTYIATLKGGISIKGLGMLRHGVRLDDFVTSPADVEILDAKSGTTTVKIIIHEGKYRQVRRMFEAVGCKVAHLQRVAVGTVELGNLPLGRWRHLTSHEISYLKNS